MKPRDLNSVLGDMLGLVPDHAPELRAALGKLREKCWFTAPEAMRIRWQQAQAILVEHIGPPPWTGWQKSVRDAFVGSHEMPPPTETEPQRESGAVAELDDDPFPW